MLKYCVPYSTQLNLFSFTEMNFLAFFVSLFFLSLISKTKTNTHNAVFMKFKAFFVFLACFFTTISTSYAQEYTPIGFEAGLSLGASIPQGEFADQNDAVGFGGNLHFLYQLPATPVALGVNIGFMNYGSESRNEPFSTTIPDVTVRVTNSNNLVNGHLVTRIQPPNATFKPYLEGLFGFNYLFTDTKIEDNDFDDDDVASSTNFEDWTTSMGLGIGFRFKLTTLKDENAVPTGNLFLEVGTRYLWGGEAEYLKEGSIGHDNGKVVYDVTQSRTDLMQINVGVVFEF